MINRYEYTAIAKMIKLDDLDIDRIIKAKHSTKENAYYEGMNRSIQNTRNKLIKLANYFEKRRRICSCGKGTLTLRITGVREHCHCNHCKDDYYRDIEFNKKIFLELCGVNPGDGGKK